MVKALNNHVKLSKARLLIDRSKKGNEKIQTRGSEFHESITFFSFELVAI